YTAYDETCYHLAMPADGLETAVDILSDLVFSPSYDPEEYAREKEVVIEEIRRADDSPQRWLYDVFFEDAFGKGHPYGHRILGSAETVAAAGRDTAFAFHGRFYRPDNCVLIITGGFDPKTARELAARYLAGIPNPPGAPGRPEAARLEAGGPRVRILRSPKAKVPKIVMGFACPSARDAEAPAVELLSAVLSAGDSSRLTENVRYRKGLAPSVSCFPETLLDGGVFLVLYETSFEKILPAFDAVVDELNSLSSEPPSPDELARARALAAKGFVDRQEAPASAGGVIASFELYNGDYRMKDAYLNIWSRSGGADLAELAASLFVRERLTVTALLPEDSPELDGEALTQASSRLKPAGPRAGAARAGHAFEEIRLESGAKLFVMRDPTLPLVEAKAAVLGGRLAEGEGREGLVSLASSVWARASSLRDAPSMSRAVEDLGAFVGGFSGRNTLGLDGSFLSSTWREGLGLFAELLTAPAFGEEDFERRKEEHLTFLKGLEESLADRVFRLARRGLFRGHPYSVESHGTLESVGGLERGDALGAYRRLVRPESLVFAVAGDISPKEAAKALDAALSGWKPEPAGLPAPQAPPPPPELPGPAMASEVLDRAQAHIAISFLAPGMGSGDHAALEVLNSILSGMGGVLFSELREKRSLAYSVTSSYGAGLGTGSFNFYIGCAPDKAGESLSGMLGIIRAARSDPYGPDAVESAKSYLAGSNKIHHQTLGSRVSDAALFELYGLGQDRNERLLAEIASVAPGDVLRVAREYLPLDRAVLSVVGNEASVKTAEGLFGGFEG
ncbi:MAG: insulinase family protein, partial [Deltaproteobacteria bacterium]|nr:insulinase family protein [Deltaproteobacteria bacterium]